MKVDNKCSYKWVKSDVPEYNADGSIKIGIPNLYKINESRNRFMSSEQNERPRSPGFTSNGFFRILHVFAD